MQYWFKDRDTAAAIVSNYETRKAVRENMGKGDKRWTTCTSPQFLSRNQLDSIYRRSNFNFENSEMLIFLMNERMVRQKKKRSKRDGKTSVTRWNRMDYSFIRRLFCLKKKTFYLAHNGAEGDSVGRSVGRSAGTRRAKLPGRACRARRHKINTRVSDEARR